ncbi:MAG: phosphoribosylglycinamide formyltransferase 1 [Thermoplasmata archaeon]|jgi:formyltetrahydrofolate-dependent phosphoribosylglycinamide formyltransferase|nr:phosphoribosylglycinamide formyltransferase 1 [Thermoplasmata archaeon]
MARAMPRLRLAVLVSGRGTNLENLLRASREGRMDADIILVASNRAEAPAVAIARAADVPVAVLPSAGLTREEHERQLDEALSRAAPDLVLLAGYMRILTPAFIRRHPGRLLNIHPSLLPVFPGLEAQQQAHAAGVRIAGCTTHFVTETVDGGPILMQAAVAIPPGASAEDVRLRIRDAEHAIYPASVQLLASGRARWEQGKVVFDGASSTSREVLLSP